MKRKRFKNRQKREIVIPKCPKCESENTAKVLYGLYDRDEKMQLLLDQGKVVLGGCEITFDSPSFYCNECRKEF